MDDMNRNKIFAQAFSPCGKFLFVGDRYGVITQFNIANLITATDAQTAGNKFKFQLFTEPTQYTSFVTTEEFLICGTDQGTIHGISWSSLDMPVLIPRIKWTIELPEMKNTFVKNEVKCMWFDAKTNLLYVGCGDYSIDVYTLQEGHLVRTLESHKNDIYDIHSHNNQLVSSDKDGTVCLWDLRAHRQNYKLHPFRTDRLARPELGNWIGAVALNDDWMLCGGGPRASLWNLSAVDITAIFPLEDNGINVCKFYKDRVMIGGTTPYLHQFDYNGDYYAQIPISSRTAYSVIQRREPNKVLCIAGSSRYIDLCTKFSDRNQILEV